MAAIKKTKKRRNKDGWAFITTQVPAETKAEIKSICREKGWNTEGEFVRSLFNQVISQHRQEKEKPR